MKYQITWTGIDRGHEGQWTGPVWMTVFEVLNRNTGQSYQDPSSPIYTELQRLLPDIAWLGEADAKKTRPFFRDAREPWAETDVIKFNETTGLIEQTDLGKKLSCREVDPADVLIRAISKWEEAGERPFSILSQAFLAAADSLSLDELMKGVMQNFRPGADTLAAALSEAKQSTSIFKATEIRRFKHMLALMASVGAISEKSDRYIAWNRKVLGRIKDNASRPSATGTRGSPSSIERRLKCALASKQFIILAGGTGTGKTRAAELVAYSIAGTDNVAKIAVGADWTDKRHLLGFRNLLASDGMKYVAPRSLLIILKALKNPRSPHFLILDEMNLSHVERYFADFLSSMEDKKPLDIHDAATALQTESGEAVNGQIDWPKNLFVIGTVNIDETTYMFSPKVLDRAHVIEFKVAWDEIKSGLEGAVPGELPALQPVQVDEFMRVSGLENKTLSEEDHDALVEVLEDMHEALDGTRFAFAHRTARECLNFIASAQALAKASIIEPQDTSALIDLAILQKALPKLNGSAGTLNSVLDALIKVADKHDLELSEKKLKAMQAQLKADQFVSFIQ